MKLKRFLPSSFRLNGNDVKNVANSDLKKVGRELQPTATLSRLHARVRFAVGVWGGAEVSAGVRKEEEEIRPILSFFCLSLSSSCLQRGAKLAPALQRGI